MENVCDPNKPCYQLVDLKQGDIHIARKPTLISTLLGSCVSVCLYSLRDSVGAMSHSVLPSSMLYSRNTSDVRYVESAIDKILHELYGMGIPASRLRAKVFGGAEMFRGNHDEIRLARIVGDGNIKAAKDVLNTHAISIVSECVGGNSGRKLVFDSVTGVVFLRRLSHNSAVPIAAFCKSA